MTKKSNRITKQKRPVVRRITKNIKQEIEQLAEALAEIAPTTTPGSGFCVQRVAEEMGLKRYWKKQKNKKADIAYLLENVIRYYPRKSKSLVLAIVKGGVEWMARRGKRVTQDQLNNIVKHMKSLGFNIQNEVMNIDIPESTIGLSSSLDTIYKLGSLQTLINKDLQLQIERILSPIRNQHIEIMKSVKVIKKVVYPFQNLAWANQHWFEILSKIGSGSQVFNDLKKIHSTWFNQIKYVEDSVNQLQFITGEYLSNIIAQMTISEKLFARINFDNLYNNFALPSSDILKLQTSCLDFTASYKRFVSSIRTISDLFKMPKYVLYDATREVFTTGHALSSMINNIETVIVDKNTAQLLKEVEDETSKCIHLLAKVNPALVKLYKGARKALNSDNPDRVRHVLSSLRELWNHLLRYIAPDDKVLAWLPKQNSEFINDKGKPTRKARILYVCRFINSKPLSEFLHEDTRALTKLLDFFNKVHAIDPGISDEQLRALLLRTESGILYILQIWEATKRLC